MIIIVFGFIIVLCFIGFIMGIFQYIKSPKPPDGLSLKEYQQYYYNKEWLVDTTENELEEIHRQERIDLLDETILKYTRLLDNLNEQYKNTYGSKEQSAILTKQIATMEKLNRALEKREKLE